MHGSSIPIIGTEAKTKIKARINKAHREMSHFPWRIVYESDIAIFVWNEDHALGKKLKILVNKGHHFVYITLQVSHHTVDIYSYLCNIPVQPNYHGKLAVFWPGGFFLGNGWFQHSVWVHNFPNVCLCVLPSIYDNRSIYDQEIAWVIFCDHLQYGVL